ncbi:TSN36 protein, partial [Nothoprocta ornata]|nr:TSN36 protein [Nothoprocta pentlandii]NWY07714.1 TSN36 protein [Nothoprocta ornata]
RSFARTMLLFLGLVLWGTAAALAFSGAFVIMMYKNYRCFLQDSFLPLPGWLAIAAAFLLLPTGILAISISARNSRYRQGVLMYLLLILLCLEMSSAVLAQIYSTRMTSELKSTMGHLFYHYNGPYSENPGSKAVDKIQRKLQCCGVQNYTDWLTASTVSWHLQTEKACAPESCCKEKHSHCRDDLCQLEHLFQEGCLRKLEDQVHFVMLYLFWCCVVLGILELLAGFSNGILMRHQPFQDFRIL